MTTNSGYNNYTLKNDSIDKNLVKQRHICGCARVKTKTQTFGCSARVKMKAKLFIVEYTTSILILPSQGVNYSCTNVKGKQVCFIAVIHGDDCYLPLILFHGKKTGDEVILHYKPKYCPPYHVTVTLQAGSTGQNTEDLIYSQTDSFWNSNGKKQYGILAAAHYHYAKSINKPVTKISHFRGQLYSTQQRLLINHDYYKLLLFLQNVSLIDDVKLLICQLLYHVEYHNIVLQML